MDALCFYLYGNCSFCVLRWCYAAFNYFFPFIISHLLRQAELHSVACSDLDMWQAKINILPLWHRWQIVQHAQSSAVHNSKGGQSRTGLTQRERPQNLLHLAWLDIMEKCVRGLQPRPDMLEDCLTVTKYKITQEWEREEEGGEADSETMTGTTVISSVCMIAIQLSTG